MLFFLSYNATTVSLHPLHPRCAGTFIALTLPVSLQLCDSVKHLGISLSHCLLLLNSLMHLSGLDHFNCTAGPTANPQNQTARNFWAWNLTPSGVVSGQIFCSADSLARGKNNGHSCSYKVPFFILSYLIWSYLYTWRNNFKRVSAFAAD